MTKLRKDIEVWGKKIGLRASPLAPVVYRQEFESSLTGDFVKMTKLSTLGEKLQSVTEENLDEHEEDFNDVEDVVLDLLQIVYAMNRADNFGKGFPEYESWLNDFEYMDFTEVNWITEVIPIVKDGFFRNGQPAGKQTK